MMSKCKILGDITPPQSKPFTFTLGISDKTYCRRRKQYGGMGLSFPPKLEPRILLKLSLGGIGVARKRYNEEDILGLLREIEVHLHGGMDVVSACLDPPIPTHLCKKNRRAYPAPRSGRLAWFWVGGLP